MKKYLIASAIIVVIVITITAAWIFTKSSIYKIEGNEMQSNYNSNDIVLLKKPTIINRGDVVVFKLNENPLTEGKIIIRRVIGIPGDYIEIKNGKVFITPKGFEEAKELTEDYLDKDTKTCLTSSNSCVSTLDFNGKKFEVPLNSYFLLGDNRLESEDSRHWKKEGMENPFIEHKDIIGKVGIKIWPI